jgi:nitrogen regulatory protein PII
MLQAVKKIEIIVSNLEVPSILRILKKNLIEDYTLINNVEGSGAHGYTGDNSLMNSYIIIILTDLELAIKASDAIQPLLKKLGGILILSDAQWIAH